MDYLKLMAKRHSVRQYKDQKIDEMIRTELNQEILSCNQESGLHLQIVYDDKECFDSQLARYGKFSGVTNYIALVGQKSESLDEKCGYYGERLVLKAQELGLNTCWVGLTYGKNKCKAHVAKGEKLRGVIAIGYGMTQGTPHKNKPISQLCAGIEETPLWFQQGVEGALLAPTATNQQKFYIELIDDQARIKSGIAFYAKMDLGIVKYHFELASGQTLNFKDTIVK